MKAIFLYFHNKIVNRIFQRYVNIFIKYDINYRLTIIYIRRSVFDDKKKEEMCQDGISMM